MDIKGLKGHGVAHIKVQVPRDDQGAEIAQSRITPHGNRQHAVVVISRNTLRNLLVIMTVLVFVGLAYIYREKPSLDDQINPSHNEGAPDSLLAYQEALSKVLDVPKDVKPTVSTVSDADALRKSSPTIFKNAQEADVFLIYVNADKTAKVVLFRPSTNKVITYIDGVNLGSLKN